MQSVKELLDEVHADTNAVSAAIKGLTGVSAFVDDLIIKAEGTDIASGIADLRSLVTGLIEAIPASVTPESAGPVGKSRAQQAMEAAEASLRDHMGKLAEIVQGVAQAGEHVRASAQAIADGKAAAE